MGDHIIPFFKDLYLRVVQSFFKIKTHCVRMTAEGEEKPSYDFKRASRVCTELESSQIVI